METFVWRDKTIVPLTGTPLSLPKLKVQIKNVDVDEQEVGFQFGGNYRSGRQSRWRLVVTDEMGIEIPTKRLFGSIRDGGFLSHGTLKYGDSWETVIDMQQFIESPQPGRYQLQVVYHNSESILHTKDITRRIVSKSKMHSFIVSQVAIELTRQNDELARKWIDAIDRMEEMKVVDGSYGEWAHEFISPDSPQGKILGLGLQAVPALIQELHNDEIRNRKRAWILSLLFSATGLNDPRKGKVLGPSYEYVEGGWQVWGGAPGSQPSGGMGSASAGSCYFNGNYSSEDQIKLSKKWFDWLETVKVARDQ